MADIDFELISPTATQANDAILVRRGAAAPNTGALILTADMLSRANHTGTQEASTVTGLASVATSGSASDLGTGTLPAARLSLTKAQLDTAVSDGNVLYVGDSITASTISDFSEAVDDRVSALVVAGTNITITYNDAANTLTFDAAGGGTPGGSTTQIQFNDAGAFGGDADLTWDRTGNTLSLGGTDTGIEMNGITTEPSAPAAGKLRLYAKTLGGRTVPKIKGPSGVDYALQASFWQNNIMMWSQTTATAGVWFGTSGSSSGTYANTAPTTTNLYTATKRARYSNVVTTTNQVLGLRNNELTFFRGNAAGQGGWFFFTRCGFDTWTNGGRFFAGMHTASTVISANPSALNNTAGFCVDDTDAGAISFLTRDTTTATKAATGLTITSNKGYDLFMFCAPNSSSISWRIVDFVAGTEASGSATANLPAATTTLGIGTLASNAALTPVNSVQMGVMRLYAETDY